MGVRREAAQEAAERIGGALAAVGMVRLPARVFAAILVDDDGRMTSAELADFLGVSAAGISGAVRYLVPLGLVRRERERGSRRDVYVVEDDAWRGVVLRYDQIYAPIIAAMTAASALIEDSPGAARVDLGREFLDFVVAEMADLARRWDEHKSARG